MIRLTGGFREPWIEWDGRNGVGPAAGRVWLDGQPIPVFSTECCWQSHIDDPNHPDHLAAAAEGRLCMASNGGPNYGGMLSWTMPLENGALAEVWADNELSTLQVRVDRTGPHLHEIGGRLTHDPECRGIDCPGCLHSVGSTVVWFEFESRDEYMAELRRLGQLRLDTQARAW